MLQEWATASKLTPVPMGPLPFVAMERMMTRLVGGMSKKLIRQKFDDFDGNKNGFLEFDEFKRFFKTLMPGCLTDAAKNGDVRMVKQVLEAGVAPDERDSHQSTPLIHAVWPGYREVIELLLIHRADVNAQNIKGNTAVHFAFEKDHEDIVRCGAGGSLTGRLHPLSPHRFQCWVPPLPSISMLGRILFAGSAVSVQNLLQH